MLCALYLATYDASALAAESETDCDPYVTESRLPIKPATVAVHPASAVDKTVQKVIG